MKLKPHTIRELNGTFSVATRIERFRMGPTSQPISLSFQHVLESLLDQGPSEIEALVDAACGYHGRKGLRLAHVYRWQPGDPAERFTIDVLEQMDEHDLVRREGERWQLSACFRIGLELTCIPAEWNRRAQTVTVRTKQDRAAAVAVENAKFQPHRV